MRDEDSVIEGRNVVLESFRSGQTIERLFIQQGLRDEVIMRIIKAAGKQGTAIDYLPKERLDEMSPTGHHQGVIAYSSLVSYCEVDDILDYAAEKEEDPFIIILDEIEDPHNVGAIIRTADACGCHGIIMPKRRTAGLTAAVQRASAGALNYAKIARVTNIGKTIDELKKKGLWFICAYMDGQSMYDLDMTGPMGLVIGNEGSGVQPLIRKKCDMTAAIPMKGHIGSLNASVAAGVMAYEILRQRIVKGR